jgi:predicted esterase
LPTNDPLHPYQIILLCAPPAQLWNGRLVVYAHGYVDPSLPISLPTELNLYLPNTTTPNPASLPAVLLSQGFAVATTSYRKNGYDVEQGGQDIDALVKYAKQALPGSTNRVYLIGASQGALISTQLLERSSKTYNGGLLSLCGAVGGWAYETQYTGDFATVFNYFFPGVAAQGPVAVALALQNNPLLAAQLFSVTGAAVDPSDPSSAVTTALSALFFSSPAAQLDLQTTAGGNPYGNLRTRYRGSFNDQALNAGVARIAADRAAQRYVSRFYTPTGEIKRPVVTLHNLLDPVVPFAVEQLFAQRVNDEGHASLLTSIPARHSYGHCNFDPDEILGAFGVLVAQAQ